jgi:hypothetical protein
LVLLAAFTAFLAFGRSGWVFIDGVNLLFHEAGHFLFGPFGETTAALGGTLNQLLFPLGLAIYFALRRREALAAFACAWWVGENLLNTSVYMRDAINMGLPLIGGERHDWNFIFSQWGVLKSCLAIGRATQIIGWVIMVASLAGVAWLIVRPVRHERVTALPTD